MRNLIRHEIVPVIEKINPNFIQTNLKTVQRLKEAEEFLAFATDQLELIDYKEGKGYINKEKLQRCSGRPTILYTLLNKHGFSYDQAVAIGQVMENTGAMFYAAGWSLNIDRDHLILAPIVEPAEAVLLNKDGDNIELATGILTTSVIDAKNYTISHDPTIAALDIDLLNFPLQVRPYLESESFYPLGMKGRKKISDFLIDAKVPRTLKSEVMVLVNNNEIVWLVGMRINDRYKISATTKKVFEVRFKVRQA
jgi:tRNA(Ile)-lysidine synthase